MCSVYVPEGIVLAADSRMTGNIMMKTPDGKTQQQGMFAISDNAQKVFLLNKVRVGIASCGLAILENKTVSDYLRLFEIEEVRPKDNVTDVAKKLQAYAYKYFPNVHFFVCGYEEEEPFVYDVSKELRRINMDNGRIKYASSWSGEQVAITKLLNSQPPTPVNHDLMPLKDAVDFAEFLIDVTIKLQRFEMKPKTCGGAIDVLVLTKDSAFWHKHKLFKPSVE
jgi:20S proteasome alpha/beta subunit